MKGVQQCRDVQADFVCKLEKEQVDAFEVYPNTVRLNLLNGCPSRPPLRLCCIFFVFCETREGTISLFPFIFFLQTPPLTRPLPNLRLPQRLLTTVPQYTVRFPMLGPEVSMF